MSRPGPPKPGGRKWAAFCLSVAFNSTIAARPKFSVDRLVMNVPDHAQVAQWLQRAGIDFYQCDECHGLHLAQVQEEEAVSNAGLYVEPRSSVLSSEEVVRPMGLLRLRAELGRLNMDYPLLEPFLVATDDSMPQ